MAPGVVPSFRANAPIEKGQATIQAALSRGLSYMRPPCPGPVPKDSGRIIGTVLGRRLLNGDNEKLVQELFASIHISQAVDSEPGDQDDLEGRFLVNDNDSEEDYSPSKCYKYTREYKLARIEYF